MFFDLNSTEMCSVGPNWQYISIGSDKVFTSLCLMWRTVFYQHVDFHYEDAIQTQIVINGSLINTSEIRISRDDQVNTAADNTLAPSVARTLAAILLGV